MVTAERIPVAPRKAITAVATPGPGRTVVGRLWDGAELVCWLATINLLVLVFTVLGGVVLGAAPALAAAVRMSRARLQGRAEPVLGTFARHWRREWCRANLLLLPFGAAAVLLSIDLVLLGQRGGPLVALLWASLAITVVAAALTATLDAHYELALRRTPLLALRFAVTHLPGALLLVAITALAAAAVLWLPGLLPVIAIGAWVHAVTGVCLSLYARNDALLDDRAAAAAGHHPPYGHHVPPRGTP